MTDPNHSKSGFRPGGGETPASTGSGSKDTTAGPGSAGRVVHDSRGNAVWQWVKDTGRACIESTSVLLRRLELPELKVQDKDDELRLEDDVDAGGGFDPYGTRVGTKKKPEVKAPFKKG